MKVTITVNGQSQSHDVEPRTLLVHFIREECGLTGTNVGCDTSSCGACTVHIDGVASRSCGTPVSLAEGREVTTLDGLGTADKPHPVQQAFIQEDVPQCGYCTSGWVMTAAAFLEENKAPTDAEIRDALAGLKCRCGTHMSILRAVKRAALLMAERRRT